MGGEILRHGDGVRPGGTHFAVATFAATTPTFAVTGRASVARLPSLATFARFASDLGTDLAGPCIPALAPLAASAAAAALAALAAPSTCAAFATITATSAAAAIAAAFARRTHVALARRPRIVAHRPGCIVSRCRGRRRGGHREHLLEPSEEPGLGRLRCRHRGRGGGRGSRCRCRCRRGGCGGCGAHRFR
ncbi:MAG: hypothetical protein EOO24_08515, partial [Comamonadaceae bacterium]